MNKSKEKLLWITSIAIVLAIGFNSVNSATQALNGVNKEITAKKERVKKINKKNAEIESLKMANTKNGQYELAQKESIKFFNLYFNWRSWGEFYKNLKTIHSSFPEIASNENTFNTDLTSTGTGDSGTSSYSIINTLSTDKPNEIIEIVSQTRNFKDASQSKNYMVKVTLTNGKINLGTPVEIDEI